MRTRRARSWPIRWPWLLLLLLSVSSVPAASAQPPRASAGARPPIDDQVTYARHVAPILFEHCVECHRPEGGAPFSLLTYAEAKGRARQIASVTARRTMPPWKPVPGHGGPFVGERRLTVQQIATIGRWVELGAPIGRSADLPPPPTFTAGWRLGEPDLVVRLPKPYVLPADGRDVFRNFVVPVPVSESRCVRGIEFRPGSAAVHHTNMLIDRTRTSRRFDDEDPDPGYDGPIAPDAEYPDGHFLGWTPGQASPLLPDDMCWRLEAGSDLLLQMHLQSSGAPVEVQPAVAFFFSSRPATRIPVMLRLGRQDIDVPAGLRNHSVRDTYVLPVDAHVQAVQPHAHYLAREISGWAELPDGSRRWLVHITDWDFHWQDVYRFTSPFWLPAGTRLVMEYVYDNSAANPSNPHRPPRRVSWGQQTTDEMGDLWVQVLARNEADRVRLSGHIRDKALREDITGYRMMLRDHPEDAAIHENLAKAYLQVGQIAEALEHARESLRLEPEAASARYNLGTALAAGGSQKEAAHQFAEAVRLDPKLAYAHNSLGVALHALGRTGEASEHFRRAIEIEPTYANAHNNLGKVLELQGELEPAVVHYREALRIEPANAQTRQNAGDALAVSGHALEAVEQYRRAVDLRPDSAAAAGRLAWILATHGDAGVRRAEEAVQWAERAAASSGRRDATVLDILAAAYASAGRYDAAIATAISAADLAVASGADRLAGRIRARLDLYRQRRPFQSPARFVLPDRF